jgi:hypothetical protein
MIVQISSTLSEDHSEKSSLQELIKCQQVLRNSVASDEKGTFFQDLKAFMASVIEKAEAELLYLAKGSSSTVSRFTSGGTTI